MSVKLSISITEGPEKGKTYEFESGPVTVGRGRGDIALTDKKISGKHCQFLIEGDRVWLEDLSSTNGTFLGSSRLTERVALNNLDIVTMGLTRLSIAIVEDLEDFKQKNQTPTPPPASSSGAEEEMLVESNLDFFEAEDSNKEAEEASEGLVLEEPDSSAPAMKTPEPQAAKPIELPAEDAVYRETGVQRIESLIDDEIESFSKWDHPGMKETDNSIGGAILKVDVRIIKRKGPASFQELKCQNKSMSFGRKDVDVRINDLDLSRKHAAVEIVNGQKVFVRDLASTNGTFVNGQRISYHELKNGDLIQIGQNVFEVMIREGE